MARKPSIIVAGILDTKGQEIKYIAERVKAAGGEPTIVELSVGHEVGWADISISEVLGEIGRDVKELFSLDRGKASDIVVDGACQVIAKMLNQGKLDGIIAYGGSMGASIATRIMQTLPIGVPKFMLTTMASGDVSPYVGTKDLCMMYPIAEAGLNKVTRKILNNAAAAVVGMANAPELEAVEEKALIGCMMFGVTTPCVLRASKTIEDMGYDVMINHAVGSGGKSMEELIRDGYIVGILDITTHEIADLMLGGVLSAGPDRLTAAGAKGIPQVIAPGGLDLINFGPRDTVPEKLIQESDQPGRGLYVHNPMVTCIGVSTEEAYRIGEHIAQKMNAAKGPTVMCIPMRGWGACDIPSPNKELGWAGPGAGPTWASDPEHPEWSLRNGYFIKALRKTLSKDNPNLDVILVDKHLNEPEFADLMTDLLQEMLQGKWKKGSHQDLPYV
ncbi:MAG TPA: Tm-1-like ATP-binding domain-containing protein, partial [Syntrophomonadaceae bacterium]|nr:Tm-1-like ATP-binding domain-containing protein [Syntrophomonadaceae bacterium]